MPIRQTPLINNHFYHIFNRGVNRVPIFNNARDYQRLLALMDYCRYADYPIKFSVFKNFSSDRKRDVQRGLKDKFVNIVAYTLMPNHFHLVLHQKKEHGITNFINRFLTSYTKFFNLKYERSGPLFEGRFKAVLIETDEQLNHVVRYIHLNPYSSGIISNPEQLTVYPWSSFKEYLNPSEIPPHTDEKDIILANFKIPDKFRTFTLDQADYQKALARIRHLLNE